MVEGAESFGVVGLFGSVVGMATEVSLWTVEVLRTKELGVGDWDPSSFALVVEEGAVGVGAVLFGRAFGGFVGTGFEVC